MIKYAVGNPAPEIQTFLNGQTETISDYLNNNTIIFWEYKRVKENYEEVIRDITDWYDSTHDYPKLGFELVKDMNHIYSGKSLYLDVFGDVVIQKNTINIHAKDAVVYNNNIHMLLHDIQKYNGYTTIVITFKNDKGLRHFTNLVDEKVPFYIIGNHDEIIEKRLNLLVSNNELSFELYDTNMIVLNEDNLFKQKEHKKKGSY